MSTHTARASRTIPASQEDLFDAWLNAESMNKWMCPIPGGSAKCTIDARVGGSFAIDMFAPDGTKIPHSGVFSEIERPDRLVFSWVSPYSVETRVTVTFAGQGNATEVTIVHELFAEEEQATNHQDGWTQILAQLETIGS